MKLDKYDVALVNGTCKEDSRPVLQNVHLNKGRFEAADGFILVVRAADISPEEKEITALIPAKLLRTVKTSPQRQAILTVKEGELGISYQDAVGKVVEFNPIFTFQPARGDYPIVDNLFPKGTTKTVQVALRVGLLKKCLSCMPDEGTLRIGVTQKEGEKASCEPVEFECSNMDRPIQGMIMPMMQDWTDFKWHREPELKSSSEVKKED